MRRRKTAVSFIFVAAFLLLAARQDAQAKTVSFKSTASGTSTLVLFSFDTPNFTNLATQATGSGKFKPGGEFTIWDIGESAPDGKNCTVPGGMANAGTESTLVGDIGVTRIEESGDLLYAHATSSTTCIDFSSGTAPFPFVGSSSAVITGGTGKYAGATGTTTGSVTGVILSLPGGVSGTGPGGGVFQAFQASSSGTLTTP
jgi:hypothetical protein